MGRSFHTSEWFLPRPARWTVALFAFWAILVGATFPRHAAAQLSQDPSLVGQWNGPVKWPIVPVHMHVLPDGRVLAWQHHEPDTDTVKHVHADGTVHDTPNPHVWNVTTGAFLPVPIPSNLISGGVRDTIFCAGHSFLPDGRLFVTGGHKEGSKYDQDGSEQTHIFDWRTNSWAPGPNANDGRWYPTNTPLGTGETLISSGNMRYTPMSSIHDDSHWLLNVIPQVLSNNASAFNLLPGPGGQRRLPMYPMVYQAPDGRVFYAGPERETGFLDLATGQWGATILANFPVNRNYPIGPGVQRAASVMYDTGKILIVGGSGPAPSGGTAEYPDQPTAQAEAIDLNMSSPTWRVVAPMAYARQQQQATLLPDGKVLVTGGTSAPGYSNATHPLTGAPSAVKAAEVWDPATEKWSTLASAQIARIHHSTAVLLPDGRVLAGGGGQNTGLGDWDHYDVEFFSPPYLFKGPRPTISGAPTNVGYGQTFSVQTPDAASITKVSWIRLPSTTHSFNQNQGVYFAPFLQADSGTLNVLSPANGNVCPPGHYMLFLLNNNGVPSVAKIIQITEPLSGTQVTGTNDAAFVSQSVPTSMTAGQSYSVSVTMRNSGTSTWTTANKYNLGSQNPQDNKTWGFDRVPLPASVAPNTEVTFKFTVTAPATAGTYNFQWRVVQDGVAWFGAYTPNVAVDVTAAVTPAPGLSAPAAPSNLTGEAVSVSQINLGWTDNANNEDVFKIERSLDGKNFTEIATVGANVTGYSDGNLMRDTFYSYRVRAYNAAGYSAFSNTVKRKTRR